MSHIPDLRGDVAIRGSTASSNSSRESSPNPNTGAKKRSFLPDSDDDDLDIVPTIDVNTSTPQIQPVIRQPLAFSSVSTGNISVYEASVSDTVKSNTFLPGQEVQSTAIGPTTPSLSPAPTADPMPSPSPGPTSSSSTPAIASPRMSANSSTEKATSKGTRKPRATKRAKHADDLSFSTGRFRISQYSSTPSDTPPLHHGQGPYSSMYRHRPGTFIEMNTLESGSQTIQIPPPQQPIPQPSSPISSRTSQTLTVGTMQEDNTASQSRTSNRAAGRAKSSQAPRTNDSHITQDVVHLYPPPSRQDLASTVQWQGSPESPYRARGGYPTGTALVPSPGDSSGQYTRRYEPEYPPGYRPAFPSQQPPGQREHAMSPPSGTLQIVKGKGREVPSQVESSRLEQQLVEKQRGPTRLVTLLIEDKRANPRDHLLAEVNIFCWNGPTMSDLWCDAKDLSEALQSSASRIDGPAKVFTKRGDYRQCFLRVGFDQVNHCSSMNIKLLPDRTVPITVEHYDDPTIRALPSPSTSYEWRSPWHTPQHHDSGRYHAESSRSRHGHSSPEYQPDSRRSSWKGHSDFRDSRYETRPISRQSSIQARRTHVPLSDSSEDEMPQTHPSLNPGSARIILADKVDQLIRSDMFYERYESFWNTSKYSSILRACETVQKLRKNFRGRQVQISARDVHVITEIDVARSLGARDPEEFNREVDDTLRLLSIYGENGTRSEEPAVLGMLRTDDKATSPRSQLKSLLRLLRDVDKRWKEEHPDEYDSD